MRYGLVLYRCGRGVGWVGGGGAGGGGGGGGRGERGLKLDS